MPLTFPSASLFSVISYLFFSARTVSAQALLDQELLHVKKEESAFDKIRYLWNA